MCEPNSLSFVISAEGLIQVFGYEGRDVKFSCHYDQGYEDSEKYFCKNDCGSSDVLITTKQKNKGKYSITDDKKIRLVTVTISGLQSHDAGKYWCGVTGWFIDTYSEVKLHIKEVSSQQTSSVSPTSSTEQVTSQPPSHNPGKLLVSLYLLLVFLLTLFIPVVPNLHMFWSNCSKLLL
uniref:Immunoglobulin domain-containing protein n=1 Tax=Xiphophorus couchianus TaxID=32473 RepID=A0A3B5L263_9TELE